MSNLNTDSFVADPLDVYSNVGPIGASDVCAVRPITPGTVGDRPLDRETMTFMSVL